MKQHLREYILRFLSGKPILFLFYQLLYEQKLKGLRKDKILSVYKKFTKKDNSNTIAVDLGSGTNPANEFQAETILGLDVFEDKQNGVSKCRLGFEDLPYGDNTIDYLTANDLLEHIPRYSDNPETGRTPFIYLMNECYRVLKKDGIFISSTPIYPYFAAFQDPTHNNIMTPYTFRLYFSNQKTVHASSYGINTNFKIRFQRISGQHLIAVLQK